jgi:D-amino peptidase
MPKKYMIRCDMEGVGGIVHESQASPHGAEYAQGRAWFMAELVALVEGLREGGADEVVVYDEHYYGRNIDLAQLPKGARAICGKPPYRGDWAGGLDASFAGLVLHGFHSKSGTRNGLLCHTYEPDIADLLLNGVSVGEIGMEAAIAGDFGVPTVLVVADSAGVAEAAALLPGVVGVAVKESVSVEGAVCMPQAETLGRIRAAAQTAVRRPPLAKPYAVGPSVALRVRLNDGPYRRAVQGLFRDRMEGERDLALTASRATDVWAEYWQIKRRAQAAVPR